MSSGIGEGVARGQWLLGAAFGLTLAGAATAGTIAAGTDHSIAVKDDGSVWVWGDNSHGQLGNGTSGAGTGSLIPIQVSGLSNIVAVSAGQDFSVALDASGTVFTWGDDAAGQLADGTAGGGNRTTPYQVTSLSGVSMIAAGQQFLLVQKNDGSAWACGKNANGQLGDNTTTQRATPVQVKDVPGTGFLANVVAIAAGGFHSLAVTSNGAAYAWGKNSNGQIGINNVTTPQKLPSQVLGVGGSGALANVSSVAAALNSSFALLSDGTVFSWGINTNGVLGDASTTQRTTPVQVKNVGGTGTLTGVAAIAAGDLHALAIKSNGDLYSWGKGTNGQRGNNSVTATQSSPVQVKDTPGTGFLTNVVSVAGGVSFSLAVRSNPAGTAWAWGLNTAGQVGDNSTTQRNTPVQVNGTGFTSQVRTPTFNPVAGTYSASQNAAITTTTPGSTVRYTTGTSPLDPELTDPVLPSGQAVPVTSSTTIKAKAWSGTLSPSNVAQAGYTLKVVTVVIAPGTGTYGSAQNVSLSTTTAGASIYYTTNGAEPTTGSTAYSVPVAISTGTTIKAKAWKAGWQDSDTATAVLSFNYGTLAAPSFDPQPGSFPGTQNVVIAAGLPGASIRYTLDGSAPNAGSTLYVAPVVIDVTLTLKAKAFHPDWTESATTTGVYTIQQLDIAAGDYHSAAVNGAGQLWTWGLNNVGQLGDGGTSAQRAVPTLISSITGAKAVAAGDYHTLVLKTDGTLWAFGHNAYGQLGDGSTTQRNAPVQVKGVLGSGVLSGIVAISAGAFHSLALQDTGLVFAFGLNTSGQLGDGTITTSATPVQVTSLTGVQAIAGGQTHSLAVKNTGLVWAWGSNSLGELGTGNTTPSLVPVQVSGLTGAVGVSAGDRFSLAYTSGGTLHGWGRNVYGQIGDGTNLQRTSPVAVQVISGGTAVAAGMGHSLGSNGNAYGWGYNASGPVGDGSTTNRNAPVSVGLQNVAKVRAAWQHSLALTTAGEVWAWGNNGYNQLGDGTTQNRMTSVKIADAGMAWRVATPVMTPVPGTYNANQNVVLTVATPGALVHYTTNGNDPSTSDPSVASGGIVVVGQTLTLKIKGMKAGMPPSDTVTGVYTMALLAPTLSVGTGTYSTPQTVTVSHGVAGATIRYTTNGLEPSASDPTIASGDTLPVNVSQTIKAKAFKTGWTDSTTKSAVYTLKVATPVLAPPGGGYGSAQAIAISTTTPGATLHYTTDGVDPLETDTQVTSGSSVNLNWSVTLKVRAFRGGWTPSDIVSNNYFLSLGNVAAPTLSPAPGSYAAAQTVAIASNTAGALITYTIDGTEPTAASRTYSAPFPVASTATVKARAFKADWTPSAVVSGTYTITSGAVAAPTFSLPAGRYATKQALVMTTATSGATVRYTTTGVDPTESDPVTPGGGLTIDRAMIVKARAFKSGFPQSGVSRADYIVTGAIAAGWYHSLVLKADGALLASGQNGYGQLGDGTTTGRTTFATVAALSDVRAIAAGAYHTVALKSDGTVWAFGYNQTGELGDGSFTNRPSPVQVSGLSGIVAIAATTNNSYAVRGSDGTVWAFGYNNYGQLGNGTTTTSNVPVQVSGLSGVIAVAAGGDHALALKSDGTVFGWGLDNYGQLGDGGNGSPRLTPVAVLNLFGVRKIAALSMSSFALKTDSLLSGRLWAFGSNNYGQLGDGTTAPRTVPVSGLGDALEIAAGTASAYAADIHGRTWAWGLSAIGDGTTLQRTVPTLVPGMKDAVALAGGYQFALALRADGALLAWGTGDSGQLGDGSLTMRLSPVVISGVSVAPNGWLLTDQDGDDLTSIAEYRLGTDPLDADSNDNGVEDGLEAALGQNAASADSDGDGLSNDAELLAGTDPFKADTDGDGVSDGADNWPLDPTRSSPTTDPNDHTPPTITLQEPAGATPLP